MLHLKYLDFVHLKNGLTISRPQKKIAKNTNSKIMKCGKSTKPIAKFTTSTLSHCCSSLVRVNQDDHEVKDEENENEVHDVVDSQPEPEPVPEVVCTVCLLPIGYERWALIPCGHIITQSLN